MWNKSMSLITVTAATFLLYIHLQAQVFKTSYSIVRYERQLSQLSDEYQKKKFSVSRLKSLNYLDRRRVEINAPLVMPDRIQIVHMPLKPLPQNTVEAHPSVRKDFVSLSGFIREAQAKTSR